MQLKIQRSQRTGTFGAVLFALDVRADYSAEERGNIVKYGLGPQIIYSSEAAKRHLARSGAQLDRAGSDRVADQAAGLARGALSFALAKMSLNVSIGSLAKGHHIECKGLEELLEAESTLREACKGITQYLDAAATFNGSEIVIEYERGEERVHIAQNAPPLLECAPEPQAAPQVQAPASPAPAFDATPWLPIESRIVAFCASNGWQVWIAFIAGVLALVTVLIDFLRWIR